MSAVHTNLFCWQGHGRGLADGFVKGLGLASLVGHGRGGLVCTSQLPGKEALSYLLRSL
jgi:hypothetical protein